MKKLLLLPLLVIGISLISCGEKKPVKSEDQIKQDAEQLAMERGDSVYRETTAYYPGGGSIVRQKFMGYVFLKNGKKTAIRHGEQKSYWKSGNLQAITQYVDNRKEGPELYYYDEDGAKIYYERTYLKDKKDGIVKKYYRSGRIQAETYYKSNFIGTGTQEYADNSDNTKLTMPELTVWAKDERREKGRYTIYAKVENKYDKTISSKIQFYSGMTISSEGRKYFHNNLKEIPNKNGIATITYYEGQGFPQFESISAMLTSGKGNTIFLTTVHNVK